MAWFKKSALKTTTKKRAGVLWNGMSQKLNAYPDMAPKTALTLFVKETMNLGSSRAGDIKCPGLGDFYNLLNELQQNEKMQWDMMFSMVTAQLVFDELSYDPTIGTEEDFRLVCDIVNDLLQSWVIK
jgi:hypothetical protein